MAIYKVLKKWIKEKSLEIFQMTKWGFLSLFCLLTARFAELSTVRAEMTVTA